MSWRRHRNSSAGEGDRCGCPTDSAAQRPLEATTVLGSPSPRQHAEIAGGRGNGSDDSGCTKSLSPHFPISLPHVVICTMRVSIWMVKGKRHHVQILSGWCEPDCCNIWNYLIKYQKFTIATDVKKTNIMAIKMQHPKVIYEIS